MTYKTLINKIDMASLQVISGIGKINRIKLLNNEKIRVIFLFQSSSFWPSWDSVWELMSRNNRFEVKMVLCDIPVKEKTQFENSAQFLSDSDIDYTHINDFNIDDYKPHIIFLHTPYDGHRPRSLYSKNLCIKGYRIIYIPYGIEISDIEKARSDHFHGGVTNLAWRIYTFSPDIIPYYKMFSLTSGEMVKAFGHPKFDSYKKPPLEMPQEIKDQAKGRPILLMKVHFPKKVAGKFITPSISIYKKFLSEISKYNNIFCIFMPHPKFYEQLGKFESVHKFQALIKNAHNVIEYTGDDYRPVLMNADFHVIDRSALMIEAGVTGRPVLYVEANPEEKMTLPVEQIISKYYRAKNADDILRYVDQVAMMGEDPLKEERMEAVSAILPFEKSTAADLIVADIINSLDNEQQDDGDQVFESIREYADEIFMNDEIIAAIANHHKNSIKNHLSYRLGQEIVQAAKAPKQLFSLPKRMLSAYRDFKNNIPFNSE